MKIFEKILVACCIAATFGNSFAQNQSTEIDYELQKIDVRYRLFRTKNIWNFLQLDTQTGQVWQLQFGINSSDRTRIPIIKEPLGTGGKPGRFTLYPTRNIYNFVLLDVDNGKSWQVQWSTDNTQTFAPIEEKRDANEWKR
jgi:hypothetical protein